MRYLPNYFQSGLGNDLRNVFCGSSALHSHTIMATDDEGWSVPRTAEQLFPDDKEAFERYVSQRRQKAAISDMDPTPRSPAGGAGGTDIGSVAVSYDGDWKLRPW